MRLRAVWQMLRAKWAVARKAAHPAIVCGWARVCAARKVSEMPTPAMPPDSLQDESMARTGADASALLSPHAASRSVRARGETVEDSKGGAHGEDVDLPLAGIYTLAEVLCLRRVCVLVCLRVLPPAPPLCSHDTRCRTEAACWRHRGRRQEG